MTAAVMGRQTPRLRLAPPAASSAADDCIDIYHSCGQRLDPWQKTALVNGCGENADTTPAAFEVCLICQRQNGKGAVIEALMLASAFIWGNRVTVYSAHRLDTARATFRRVRALIEGNDELMRRCKPISDSDDHIELIGGARLEFRTRTARGGRGLTGDLVILDEALDVDPDQLASLVPIMLARPYAQLWYTSTVPENADQHLCLVRARALDGGPRLAWIEWGVDRDFAQARGYDSPEVLAQANPAMGIRITRERLLDLRGILGDAKFATECLGIWPESVAGAALDAAAWARMADAESSAGLEVALALDVAPMRDHATIGLYSVRADGLEHVQLLDYDTPDEDWEGGSGWIVARVAEWRSRLDPIGIAMRAKNGTRAFLDALAERDIKPPEDPDQPGRGDLMILDDTAMADAVGRFIDGFRAGRFRHLGQDPLDAAILNVKARPIGDAGQIVWDRRRSTGDLGPIETVTAARYCHEQWHDLVMADYDVLGSLPQVEGQCPHCDAWAPPGSAVTHYDDCVTLLPPGDVLA